MLGVLGVLGVQDARGARDARDAGGTGCEGIPLMMVFELHNTTNCCLGPDRARRADALPRGT